MSRLRVLEITSVADLRAATAAWDDLWWRSAVAAPTARAGLLAQWLNHFAPRAEFRALVVADGDQWLAALPLVAHRVGRLLSAGALPGNEWAAAGELLLDETADAADTMDQLIAAARNLPWQWLWLDHVVSDAPRWQAFCQACQRAEMACHRQSRFPVAWLPVEHDWEAYKASLSRSHRQAMSKAGRRLEKLGDVQFRLHMEVDPAGLAGELAHGFEVEDRSWKGRAGSSVLRTPGMFDFFLRQAEQLAEWGQLSLATLECGGRTVAFMYAYWAKGVYHAFKIGYDPEYAACSPGQLLFREVFERLHGEPDCRAIDFMGPLTEATSRWRPASYQLGRMVVAPRRFAGRTALWAYRNLWPLVRRLRGGNKSQPSTTATAEPNAVAVVQD